MSGAYCIYLRKSRADLEAEQRGEGETLSRHQAALQGLAGQLKLRVSHIYREVVSGETIADRPVMRKLLEEVEQGEWAGVLVMEVERLARGDTVDQGVVARAFRLTGTLIVTPLKTYDPCNEFDEEYFEFGLFMSRREYKSINRRLQQGRLASVREGKYVANRAPYGYRRRKLPHEKGYTLEIDPHRADVIRLIYRLFVDGEPQADGSLAPMGTGRIARRLNELGIPSATGRGWGQASVRDLLINPVFAGKIRWNWRKSVKGVRHGSPITSRPRRPLEDCELADGLHPAIIPEDLWLQAQRMMAERAVPANTTRAQVRNPLSGLVICGNCGRQMVRRADSRDRTPPALICSAACGNASSYLHCVEDRVLAALSSWLGDVPLELDSAGEPAPAGGLLVSSLEQALQGIRLQKDSLHDLLEQGIYSAQTFCARLELLEKRQERMAIALRQAQQTLHTADLSICGPQALPRAMALPDIYRAIDDPALQNRLLKKILAQVVYTKAAGGRWRVSPDGFALALYPRVCRQTQS